MDERFEWLDIPEEDEAPAGPAEASWDRAVWLPQASVRPAGPSAAALVEMGIDLPDRRIDLVPTGSRWPAEPYALYQLRLEAESLRLASGFDRLICLPSLRVEHLEHQHHA